MTKVKFLQMHTDLFVPGLGSLKNTLPPDNKTIPGLVMTWLDSGAVRLDWGNTGKAVNSAIIAAANIKVVVLEQEALAKK